MRATLVDLIRLIIILLLLPLMIVLIGPLLVLAVLRGHQRFGPIMLDSSGYDFAGKAGIFMLGLALWLMVWSGLTWLTIAATSPPVVVVQAPQATAPVEEAAAQPTFTPTPAPPTPTLIIPTATTPAPTSAATFTPTPTGTLRAAATPTTRLTATGTSTPTPTNSLTPSGSPQTATPAVASTPTRLTALTSADRLAAIETVERANVLLQNAISNPNEENLANLAALWQDSAYTKVEQFAIGQYQKYAKPFTASFEFISPPVISQQSTPARLVVTSRERWSYGGTNFDEEAFEFIYTLSFRDDAWIITFYTYRNLPLPTPTLILVTPTATPAATPTGAEN